MAKAKAKATAMAKAKAKATARQRQKQNAGVLRSAQNDSPKFSQVRSFSVRSL
jgi:hypothetical protein